MMAQPVGRAEAGRGGNLLDRQAAGIVGADGDERACTSEREPVVTIEVDPSLADRAKQTYPRNVAD